MAEGALKRAAFTREAPDVRRQALVAAREAQGRARLVPDQRDSRRIAKTINFGIIYGMSPFGLSKELGISLEEARAFIAAYFQTFPGVQVYIDRVVDEARKTGYVSTLLGRRRQVPELTSADRSQREFGRRVAINMPVQGLAADMIKTAMVAIHRLLERRNAR